MNIPLVLEYYAEGHSRALPEFQSARVFPRICHWNARNLDNGREAAHRRTPPHARKRWQSNLEGQERQLLQVRGQARELSNRRREDNYARLRDAPR